jgi:hypothetical protein
LVVKIFNDEKEKPKKEEEYFSMQQFKVEIHASERT